MTEIILVDYSLKYFYLKAPFLFFIFAFSSLKPASMLSSYIFKESYNKISIDNKIDWDGRLISTYHAIILAAGSILVLFTEPLSDPNYVSNIWKVFIGLSVGYSFFDICYIIYYWKNLYCYHGDIEDKKYQSKNFKKNLEGYFFLIHHLVLIVCHGGVALTECGMYISALSYLFEFTTIFLNIRNFMFLLNLCNNIFYFINIIILLIFWLIVRVLLSPYLVYLLIAPDQYGIKFYHKSPFVYWFGLFTAIILFFLNYWWSFQLTKGVVKLVTGKYSKKN